MKRILLIIVILVWGLVISAQTAKEEALRSLDTAKGLLQKDNYAKAQDEINFALAKIGEILSEELVKYIPDAPSGFTQTNKSAQGMGELSALMGGLNAVSAKGAYSKGEDTTVDLTIMVGGILGKAAGLAGLAQLFGGDTSTKTIRVSGYSGKTEYDASARSGKLTIQVGEKISVIIEGNGIDNAESLKAFADKMDLAKLEKAF